MKGYEVITFDDAKAGTVVGRRGQFLIVEHGSIFKHRRPLPERFATVDDDARVVRATVSRDVLESAPELDGDALDEEAAVEHYGLWPRFSTAAEAELAVEDAPLSAEQAALGERANVGEHLGPGQGRNDRGLASPGITGGDRRRDARP